AQADWNHRRGDAGHSLRARHLHGLEAAVAGGLQFPEAGGLRDVGNPVHDRPRPRLFFPRQIDLRSGRDRATPVAGRNRDSPRSALSLLLSKYPPSGSAPLDDKKDRNRRQPVSTKARGEKVGSQASSERYQ